MDILKKLRLKIIVHYNPNKEYVVIAVSVLLSIIFTMLAFYLGHDLKEIKIDKNIILPFGIDHILILGLFIAITPYAIYTFLEKRKIRKYEDAFANFLFEMSEMMRGGLDPIKSVIEISRISLSPISKHLKNAAFQMILGYPFEKVMRNMGSQLESKTINRYMELLIHASQVGGDVSHILYDLSEDMKGTLQLEKEKESSLKQYASIFYLAQLILVFMVYIVATQMLPQILDVITTMPIGSPDLLEIDFGSKFLHFLIASSFMGGLIIGKIIEGSVKHGLKHSVILMAISYSVCVFFILSPSSGDEYKVVLLNENITAKPLSSLTLEFEVKKIKGKQEIPLKNENLKFSAEGPSNVVIQKSVKTDNDGKAKVKMMIGEKPGNYTIIMKIKDIEKRFTVMVEQQENK